MAEGGLKDLPTDCLPDDPHRSGGKDQIINEEDVLGSSDSAKIYPNIGQSSVGRPGNGNIGNAECKTASQYSKELNDWLWQCYYWHTVTYTFPYFLWSVQQHQQQDQRANIQNPFTINPNQATADDLPRDVSGDAPSRGGGGEIYAVPSCWKRFAAEGIDFFILLIIKSLITFIAVDFFDVIDVEKYSNNLESLREDLLDYQFALEMTMEILILEFIHRIIVCVFEALCLHRGVVPGVGGSTPGKSVLGLKVVACHVVHDVGNGRVMVAPAGDIGIKSALLRAFVKNFSVAFFFPLCLTVFLCKHKRAAYDILGKCIVVENVNHQD